jgi:cytosine/adenosine deaminase-related metal-dependent hydrolase
MKRALLLALAACGAAPAAPTSTPPELRYQLWTLSRRSGHATISAGADGTRRGELFVLENGRGPQTRTTLRYAADGTLVSFEATGRDWIGKDAAESFAAEAGRARWRNMAESGERGLAAPAFYLPLAADLDSTGGLARALRRAGGRLPLIPEGEARLEELGERTVTAGENRQRIAGFAIVGVSLQPSYVWLDGAGEVFAIVDSWSAWVREGWRDVAGDLREAQDRHLEERLVALARRHARRPAGGVAIVGARVLDGAGSSWLEGHTVVVRDGKIAEIGRMAPPAGVEVIDARGRALLPGLWDSHQHLGTVDGALDVASGITTARDMANDPDAVDRWKARFDDGTEIGPHLVRAGFVEGRNEKAAGSAVTAETEAEALAAVEHYAKRGYDLIKVYNSVRPELVPVIARAAHERGLRVAGHVPVHMRAEEVVRAGYDELTHVNMLFLNFFVDRDTDTRTPLRFTLVAERAPGLDLASQPVEDFVRLLVEKRVVVDPTVGAFEELFVARAGEIAPSVRAVADRLPAGTRRLFLTGGLPVPEGMEGRYRDAARALLAMVRRLHQAGVPIVAGTDSWLVGPTLVHELELYVEAGMTPAEALRTATSVPATVMKRRSGRLLPGYDADLILVDGDPLRDIGALRRVAVTIRGGTVVDAPALGEALGIRRWE